MELPDVHSVINKHTKSTTLTITQGVEGANVFTEADVNGPNARPTYKYLKEKGVLTDVAWNFAGKFLVDKEGNGKYLSKLHAKATLSVKFFQLIRTNH